MTHEEIFQQVQAALVEMFELPPEKIVPEATLRKQLDLDSIDAVDMAVHLQKMTGRRVELEALREIKTVGDVVELVARHLAESAAASPASEENAAPAAERDAS